jgi:hypothetical protein
LLVLTHKKTSPGGKWFGSAQGSAKSLPIRQIRRDEQTGPIVALEDE